MPFVAWLANQTFFIPGPKVGFADSAIDFLQARSGEFPGWPTIAYSVKGCQQLAEDAVYWERLSGGMGCFLAKGGRKGW